MRRVPFTTHNVFEICTRVQFGEPIEVVAKAFRVDPAEIKAVYQGRRYAKMRIAAFQGTLFD